MPTKSYDHFCQSINRNFNLVNLFNLFMQCAHCFEKSDGPYHEDSSHRLEELWKEWASFKQYQTRWDADDVLGEMFISRNVDAFNLYLVQQLTRVFLEHPEEMLHVQAKVELRDVLQAADKDEVIRRHVDQVVHSLSYKGLDDLIDHLKQKHKMNIRTSDADMFRAVQEYIALRNIIVHNGRRVNSRFKAAINKPELQVGSIYPIDFIWVGKATGDLLNYASIIDSAFVDRYPFFQSSSLPSSTEVPQKFHEVP